MYSEQRPRLPLLLLMILLCLPILSPLHARSAPPESKQNENQQKQDSKKNDLPDTSTTKHRIKIQGETVPYEARAGTLSLENNKGKETAHIFYVAYTKQDVDEQEDRPVTFSFNGGPGSSSVWLHLGLLGPKRLEFPSGPANPRPPYNLIPNHDSLLDRTDLVFIDPVSTGYSRAADDVDEKQFHGVKQDIESVGKFIYQYLSKNKRWNSPKFVIGESYGTTRATGLSTHLQEQYGLELNGMMLISPILDFNQTRTEIRHLLRLPSYAATAYYHEKLAEDLQQKDLQDVLSVVEQFSIEEYAPALLWGDRLSEKRRNKIREKLSRYTGLSDTFLKANNLRVPLGRFSKQILRDQKKIVGRFDARYTGYAEDPGDDRYTYDPSYSTLLGPFSETMYDYLGKELQYERSKVYEIIADVHPWDYSSFGGRESLNLIPTLRKAMLKTPHMNIFIASGYYDLATPYFAAEDSFNHLRLPTDLTDDIYFHHYNAGHMMYIHDASRKQMRTDLLEFYDESTSK